MTGKATRFGECGAGLGEITKKISERGGTKLAHIGLQLYTLRDQAGPLPDVLRRVREIGYEGVEFAGYGGESPEVLSAVGNELGLKLVSSHVGFETLRDDPGPALDLACQLGLTYVVCPSAPESWRNSREGYLRLADLFNEVGDDCRSRGLRFGYHNHAMEFDKFDGTLGLDLLLGHTDPDLVQAELDVFWVEKAGYRATDYLKKYAGRCDVIHIKDMTRDGRQTFAEVGYGGFDIPLLVETANASGVRWLLVEQDVCERDSFDSVTMSYEYLRQLSGASK